MVRSVLRVTSEPCEAVGRASTVLSVVVVTPDMVMIVLMEISVFDAGALVPSVGVR